MKKVLCVVALMAVLSFPAHAEKMKLNPYLGFDLQRSIYDYNSNYDIGGGVVLNGNTLLEDSLDGFNIHVGNRFHENFGVEFGYFRTKEEGKNIVAGTTIGPGVVAAANFSTDVKIQGVTLDGLGYFPLGVEKRFELIGTVGISWSKADLALTVPGVGSDNVDESEFGFRVGGGGQVTITDHINFRGLARYQTADFDNVVDNAWILGFGLNYAF